ncbi:Glutathione S-transferase 1, partial [Lachnellula cervina]
MTSTTPTAESTEQPIIKLYWLEQSRSQRILWLLEELNLRYELQIFKRDPETHFAPPELKKIHPLGKSPVISITPPNSPPVVIAESALIIEYLLDHFAAGSKSTLLPKRYEEGREGQVGGETQEWLRFRYFMHYAEGSLMIILMLYLVASNIKTSPVPFFIKPITSRIGDKILTSFVEPNCVTHFSFLESQLQTSGGQYLCGKHLTGADILLSFPLIAGKGTAFTKEKYPGVWAYTERLEKEKGYEKAVEKIVEIEGKFEASLP